MKRAKLELAYSIGIILAIPFLVVLNTVLLTNSTRDAFNLELRRKSDLVNSVIAQNSAGDIQAQQYDTLIDRFNTLEASQPSVRQTQVVTKNGNAFVQLARADDTSRTISSAMKTQINIAYEREEPVARLVGITIDGEPTQAWNVATPIVDDNDAVIGVAVSSILTTDANEAIDKAYQTSFVVTVLSILVIVALLFRHLRMVGYVRLLAKEKELNQTMGDFLSVATHELRAPTTVIKGYLSNIIDGTFGPVNDKIQEQIGIVIAQTDRLNELVKDLLNVSRIEQHRIEYNMAEVDSTKLLAMIVDNYKIPAQQKGLQLELHASEEPALIKVDEGRLQEIFTNLIDNAVKYTAQGSVTVTLAVQSGSVIISIKDTGFGMSADARKRLFQRFYRIRTDNTKDISGTGLGLWIIKQYIESMNGKIEVESLEGTGSNFIVTFPLIK